MFVLDPRQALAHETPDLAPRLRSLDGATIALIHNGKTHGHELRKTWSIADTVLVGPPSPGYGGDPADAAPAAEAVMAAISAIGD
mgnify:CR=1 FL=1